MAESKVDPEIRAMTEISAALEALEGEEARRRVLKWAADRYGVSAGHGGGSAVGGDSGKSMSQQSFESFHDLIDAAKPGTGLQRILVTAYWFQVAQAYENFDSFQINKELKNLGHPSGNITRDLDTLIARSPQLVMQVRKEGTTKQARKRYRLTREGIRIVERLLAGEHEEAE
jgi:hypothetical protein